MPPSKNDAEKRIQTIIGYAERVLYLLRERQPIPTDTERKLEEAIKRWFPISVTSPTSELNATGTDLWNAATNYLREDHADDPKDESHRRAHNHRVALIRVYAYFMLDASHPTASRRHKDAHKDQFIWIFKIALKAARSALEKKEVELTIKVLERCSEYVSRAEEETPIVQIAQPVSAEESIAVKSLVFEYYLLRIAVASKTERYDVAGHFYSKLDSHVMVESAEMAEKAADLFCNTAKSLSKMDIVDQTIIWCSRALTAIDSCNVEDSSPDSPELRIRIISLYVKMLLKPGPHQNIDHGAALVRSLDDHGLGHRLACSMIRYMVVMAMVPVNLDDLHHVLMHMTKSAQLTDKTFTTIMQVVHKTKDTSTEISMSVLSEMITKRLLLDVTSNSGGNSPELDRIEKATVTYVLLATSQSAASSRDPTAKVQHLFDTVVSKTGLSFSAHATHSIQTLVWKVAGTSSLDVASEWYRLLSHTLFKNIGQGNGAKIERKLIANALARDDINSACQAYSAMSQTSQKEPLSLYLAFKIAVRSDDVDMAIKCMNSFLGSGDDGSKYLYAIVLEAQQSRMRRVAVMALQTLLDHRPSGAHFASLLRCTGRLLIEELESTTEERDQSVEKVIRVFESAAENIKSFKEAQIDKWETELQWWSKTSYNLALKLCTEIDPEQLVRLLAACSKFLDFLPPDDSKIQNDSIMNRKALCHFLSASALIVSSRSLESGTEGHLNGYVRVRQQISLFESIMKRMRAPDTYERETNIRRFELLKYELECILKLHQWDQLPAVIQTLLNFPQTDRWESLIDLVLILHAESTAAKQSSNDPNPRILLRISELLDKCINETWRKDKDITKMARWMRLTFTIHFPSSLELSSTDETSGEGFALRIAEQAASIAQRAHQTGVSISTDMQQTYPDNELQWLAMTCFNRAVDYITYAFTSHQRNSSEVGTTNDVLAAEKVRTQAKRWFQAALELARYGEDNGALHANLTGKAKQAWERLGM